MTCENGRRGRGFTLIEVIVVIAVVSILAGAAVPLVRAFVDHGHREDVGAELKAIATALEDYYFDQGAFPASLTASGFFGVYLVTGVEDGAVRDGWGGGTPYSYSLRTNPDVAVVTSLGPNSVGEGGGGDDIQASVPGSVPGSRRTRERMRIIVEVLASFLETGGLLTGDWNDDLDNMGLGREYGTDGFGTEFTLDPSTYVLRSAGPDRAFSTSDDLTS